ncbi:hypothetical protein O6H91_05G106200 [Diphasiastrum complanatum]|uniref:Uncharacterized protein n=1 Tax=Diphasiastrum complanatum TaxID=34168 RepID=A0ACC2DRQ5_DIPCM|nr:hypothetical protein O6H91_05G106200 [Diphasiastrum complanatum]
MGDLEAKGDELERKAERKIKGWGIFGNKYFIAAELLEQAGNNYKLAKACSPFVSIYLLERWIWAKHPQLRGCT